MDCKNNVRRFLSLFLLALPLAAQESLVPGQLGDNRPERPKLWSLSIAALAASETADILSSRHAQALSAGHETNSWYTNSNGQFDTGKAVAIKGATVAGVAVAEYFLMRKYPRAARVLSIANFGFASANGYAAIHNYSLK